MTNFTQQEKYSRFQINAAYFSALFGLSQVAEYIGDRIHNPDMTDVPQGAVILLGLGVAAVGTTIRDITTTRSD